VLAALTDQLQEKIVDGIAERVLQRLDPSIHTRDKNPILNPNSNAGSLDHQLAATTSPNPVQSVEGLEQQCLQALRKLIQKTDATWTCPEQWSGLEAIFRLQQDVLAIMRTGSGKSMLIILPSIIEKNQITVGILPFTSLMMDYTRKLQELKVPFEVYKSNSKLHGHNNLILVSADLTRTAGWKQEIAQLNERCHVVWMVFDEGHVAFTASNYRKSLRDLHELRQFPCQMVILSGTIPPKSQKLVIEAFGLFNPFTVRTSSNRPEIQYILEKPLSSNHAIITRLQDTVSLHYIRSS
jgi:superfamily II DNA helicase RecQ